MAGVPDSPNPGSPSTSHYYSKLTVALVALTLIAQLFTASTASAYSGQYGFINMIDDATVLHVKLDIDGVELEEVQPLQFVGPRDKYGRLHHIRKIYKMKEYTESFTMNVTYSTVPSTKIKNMRITDLPYHMVSPSTYTAATATIETLAATRQWWNELEEQKPPGDPLIDPVFNRLFHRIHQPNYDWIPDPSVLPTDINPGPFDFSLSIYNPIHWDKYHETAMLNLSVTQTFHHLELIWDERLERYTRTEMGSYLFKVEIWIILPEPGDEPPPPPPPPSKTKIYLQHDDGRVGVLFLEGAEFAGQQSIPGHLGPGWQIKAVIDMNNNGREDLVVQHEDGWLRVLYTQDDGDPEEETIRNPGTGQPRIDPAWDLKAVYDLNSNGNPDLIWQRICGELAIWFMDGLQAVNTGRLTHGDGLATTDPSWQLRAVHDLLGDGKPEVLWQNVSGENRGELAYWVLDGFERSGGGRLTHSGGRASIDPAWTMRAVHDLLGDGKPEIIWQHDDGRVSYWAMQGSTRTGGTLLFPLNDRRLKIVGCGHWE